MFLHRLHKGQCFPWFYEYLLLWPFLRRPWRHYGSSGPCSTCSPWQGRMSNNWLHEVFGRSFAYVDAEWVSQPHHHLMSSYVILLNGGPITWSARKQSLIALSTAEAEYIAIATIAREILYLWLLINEPWCFLYPHPHLLQQSGGYHLCQQTQVPLLH